MPHIRILGVAGELATLSDKQGMLVKRVTVSNTLRARAVILWHMMSCSQRHSSQREIAYSQAESAVKDDWVMTITLQFLGPSQVTYFAKWFRKFRGRSPLTCTAFPEILMVCVPLTILKSDPGVSSTDFRCNWMALTKHRKIRISQHL